MPDLAPRPALVATGDDGASRHDCPSDIPPHAAAGSGNAIDRSRQAVLLMTYGTAASLDGVEAYYTHIRGGRRPAPELLEDLLRRYLAIGGTSPLPCHTERQRAALEEELARRGVAVPVHAAMKHVEPFIEGAVRALAQGGVTHVVALPLAPHFSTLNTCAYCRAVDAGRAAPARLTYEIVAGWHAEPRLIAALAAATAAALARCPDGARAHVVFTAHSLPARIRDAGDPYPELLLESARRVAIALGLADDRWSFAFQSAGRTPEPWLGPDVRARLAALAAAGATAVVVSPVGFVADHLELLYDIDIEARACALSLGLRLERARALNDDPVFIAAIADVLERRLAPRALAASPARGER